MSELQELDLTVNVVGFLRSKLGDLQGYEILAGEIIQNADDTEHATELIFNVTLEGLEIENNDSFREVDFDRLRQIALGGKREEKGTTGAFGIGFISVYQVTDSPEIESAGRRWKIDPIRGKISQATIARNSSTRFFLRWATDAQSETRRGLGLQAVDAATIVEELHATLEWALPDAMLFLKRLDTIELRREGKTSARWTRVEHEGRLLIQKGDESFQEWLLFKGDFEQEAQRLRSQHSGIENKRNSHVCIAIPHTEENVKGALCATLPTQTRSGLPLLINADFFPSSDRKRVLFDNDFRSAWNREALKATAHTLGTVLDKLPTALGAKALWMLLNAAYNAKDDAERGVFWRILSPLVASQPLVCTVANEWKIPHETFFSTKESQREAEPLFEALALSVVHRDLRPFQNLLLSLNVQSLDSKHLAEALRRDGFEQARTTDELPIWFMDEGNRARLNREIETLRTRNISSSQRQIGDAALASCSIAQASDGVWRAPANLYHTDEATREVFSSLLGAEFFCGDDVASELLPLFKKFDAQAAIIELEGIDLTPFSDWNAAYPDGFSAIVNWFADRRAELNTALRQRLAACPIWPSGGGFFSLNVLWVTGGFDDPLKLASLLDLDKVGGQRELAQELGARTLTFTEYAKQQVPEAFIQGSLSAQDKRALVSLLARNIGELRDDNTIRVSLARCALVECLDSRFRNACEVYLPLGVIRDVLGNQVPLCRLPEASNHREAVKEFLTWLGVRTEPVPSDVLKRLGEITQLPPSGQPRRDVQRLFGYLRTALHGTEYGALKTMAWLPAMGEEAQWFKPSEIYATFQRYLFESQARFLDIETRMQNDSAPFLEWLGVKNTPEPAKVISHLLHCSQSGATINKQVYTFLQQRLEGSRSSIEPLRSEPVLLCGDGKYRRPDSVFWGTQEFGAFRTQIGDDFRPLTELLKVWGVKDQPNAKDARAVLQEISSQFSAYNAPLEEEIYRVVMVCWTMLSRELDVFDSSEAAALRTRKVVPNALKILDTPEKTFFEDRPGLRDKFQLLHNQVIARPQEAWRAMERVGVRNLSDVAVPVLSRCDEPVASSELMERLHERENLLRAVIDLSDENGTRDWDFENIERITIFSAAWLEVAYQITLYNRKEHSDAEPSEAFYHGDELRLYVMPRTDSWPWSAVGRELVYALNPKAESVRFASLLKDVLEPKTAREAALNLRDLGFADSEEIRVAAQTGAPVVGLGGEGETPIAPEGTSMMLINVPEPATDGTASSDSNRAPGNGTVLPNGYQPESATSTDGYAASTSHDGETWNGTSSTIPGGGARASSNGGNWNERPPLDGAASTSHSGTSPVDGARDDGKRSASGSQGRFSSYVSPKGGAPSVSTPVSQVQEQHRNAVDEAGIAHVLAFEDAQGRTANDMNKEKNNNPGYDIASADTNQRPPQIRFIEVKSLSGELGDAGVGLSDTQFHKAQEQGEDYWLYIVQRAQSSDFDPATDLLRVQNPAGKVGTFFFDSGWRAVAQNSPQLPSISTDTDTS